MWSAKLLFPRWFETRLNQPFSQYKKFAKHDQDTCTIIESCTLPLMRSTWAPTMTTLRLALAMNLLLAISLTTNANAQNRLQRLFEARDTNNDGKVTAAELNNPRIFEMLDLNSDGEITQVEAANAVRQRLPGLVGGTQPTTVKPDQTESPQGIEPIRQGPQPLNPGEQGIGRRIPDLAFTDIKGNKHQLSDFSDQQAIVIALTGTGCPLCLKYAPTLAAIEKQYQSENVAFVFINPNESELGERIDQAIKTHQFAGPYVSDPNNELLSALDAATTTEVFVLDASRTLAYRGAVDDQYGFGYSLEQPRSHYLTNAIDQVLAGRRPTVKATSSPGCDIYYGDERPETGEQEITYHNQIARIIQANCIECHRSGAVAPIAFESYAEVKDYAGMIGNVVKRGIMPPWFAAPLPEEKNADQKTQHWANDRSLSQQDKETLFKWIESGAPEGDPADAPLPISFPDGWLIGKPDAVFQFADPVAIKATGTMPYKNVRVKTNLDSDQWVQAIEVRPGEAEVVHHVIVTIRDQNGRTLERDGFWGVYVPGNSTLVYPEGFAKKLPKGATLNFQMHYTPNGTATEDSTSIGLVFAKTKPKYEVKVAPIVNTRLQIPANNNNYETSKNLPLRYDVQVIGFLPHMHLRGKAARYELISNGKSRTLLDVPQYDFNWQLLYKLSEPLTLRAGETIKYTAWYDNSKENPAIDPKDAERTVPWGEQTYDEMMLGYVEFVVPISSD